MALAGDEALAQALDGGGLVAGRLEWGDEFEIGHERSVPESAGFERVFGPCRRRCRPRAAAADRRAGRARTPVADRGGTNE